MQIIFSCLFFPFTECLYPLVNLSGYVPLLFALKQIKKSLAMAMISSSLTLFFSCFVFICSCPIGSRRSTRWSTAAIAPLRGLWISAPLQSLWRGYDSMWTDKMKLMAGRSQTVLFKCTITVLISTRVCFITTKKREQGEKREPHFFLQPKIVHI